MVTSHKGDKRQQVHEGGQCKPSIEDLERALAKGSIISPLLRNTSASVVYAYAYICISFLECQRQCVQYNLSFSQHHSSAC